ncbi:MAG: NADH-quinone oxidoreductase subunit N [Planctomycetota bacterium]|nr:NADH-quinone oxidoreductase subunit N [Planctomycetota bacterium]
MTDRLAFLWPEIALFIATCVVMVLGLSPARAVRKLCNLVAIVGLAAAGVLAATTTPLPGVTDPSTGGQTYLPGMVPFVKVMIAGVGLMLALVVAGSVDRAEEKLIASGRSRFDALRSNRAEFYAFFLFSLTGLMLCASADDLIWLFLALELTSLPTYIMVVMSGAAGGTKGKSQEAGVKYFFLGALGAAVFLYGFALIYGGTGSTNFNAIHQHFTTQGINGIALAGLVLAVLGLAFKIAAVPMHFYTADVYEGASAQVSAFLAFVPKTAGFVGLLLLAGMVGWAYGPGSSPAGALGTGVVKPVAGGSALPETLRLTLWVVAALTMTVGNVLAIYQTSVKRMLAYSSIAHSGYMLVGVIVGPGNDPASFAKNGVSAVLFYLLAYGVMNLGAFAVVASLERDRKDSAEPGEVETVDGLKGLCKTHPALGWTMVICSLGLLGFPPLLGFWGKFPLFTSAISAGEITLVIVLGLNSAISAYYYLRLVWACFVEAPTEDSRQARGTEFPSRAFAGLLSAGGVVALSFVASMLMDQSRQAGLYSKPKAQAEAAPQNAPETPGTQVSRAE